MGLVKIVLSSCETRKMEGSVVQTPAYLLNNCFKLVSVSNVPTTPKLRQMASYASQIHVIHCSICYKTALASTAHLTLGESMMVRHALLTVAMIGK